MTDYGELFASDLYKFVLGKPYEDYIKQSAEKVLSKAGNARTALSVGCGDGSIEAEIGDRLDLTLHDIHNAAEVAHPELHFVRELPNMQFDYVYAHGSVFASVPHEQKQKFVDDLAARVVDGGTLYICRGYSKRTGPCRAKAYSTEGHTVTLGTTERGDDYQVVTAHAWKVAQVPMKFYLADIEDYWEHHKSRINCVY